MASSVERSQIQGDSDLYYRRNKTSLVRDNDPGLAAIQRVHSLKPVASLAEVGCADAQRLKMVHDAAGAKCVGMDAREEVIAAAPDAVAVIHGVAPWDLDRLSALAPDGKFDLIVLGFVLYLMPRDQLFHLAAEIDKLLADSSHLIVFDFLFPPDVARPYTHSTDLMAYKTDPTAAWTWNPLYSLIERNLFLDEKAEFKAEEPEGWMTTDVLMKHPINAGWPLADSLPA